MAVLGVGEHRLLGLPDGALAEHDGHGRNAVRRLIDEIRPDTILTFGPDGMTFHPDHITVGRWVTEAWRDGGRQGRLLYATSTVDRNARFRDRLEEWDIYMTDQRPSGVHHSELALRVVLEGRALDRKLTALAAMASQTRNVMAKIDSASYAGLVAEEAFVDANHGRGAADEFVGAGRSVLGPSRMEDEPHEASADRLAAGMGRSPRGTAGRGEAAHPGP
jgi:LmbE family N-acetylglucosaminyl deacetylase